MKLALAALLLSCATAPASTPEPAASSLVAYCNPPCAANQKCIQLSGQPGHLLPPVCVPR